MLGDRFQQFTTRNVGAGKVEARCAGRKVRGLVENVVQWDLIKNQLRRHVLVVDFESLIEPLVQRGVVRLEEPGSIDGARVVIWQFGWSDNLATTIFRIRFAGNQTHGGCYESGKNQTFADCHGINSSGI